MASKKPSVGSNTVPSKGQPRPPVVVILGHVDHGKTTLLDTIRKTDVAGKEFGGITQSIGAYQISSPATITFIDTPGHEAFTKMRSQGAMVADIAVLVIAANDSVKPQTAESIKTIKETKIPYIVAITKIDLPEANVDKVIQDLLRHEVMLENYGGDVPFLKISAKKGEGVKELLDLIELLAEINGISGDPASPLDATIIESKLEKNRGPVATVIVKNGTLKVGDKVFVDGLENKIRALTNYLGENTTAATPGMPVEILGLASVPPVGSQISSTANLSTEKTPLQKATKDTKSGESLNLILKADTIGSLEAVTASLPPNVNLLSSGTGEINQANVLLAKATHGIILGFNVKVATITQDLAATEKVLVRTYKIIYELLDELKDAATGMLEPVTTEEILGRSQIIAEFPYEKMRIAGVKVTDGRLARGDMVKITRQTSADTEETVGQSKIKSVHIGKEEVNKAEKPKDCGLLLDPQIDFKVGDAIIAYRIV